MKRKILSVLLAVILLLSLATTAFAFTVADVSTLSKAAQPRWTYTISISTGLDIQGKTAIMLGDVNCTSDITSVKITLSLQKKVDGAWSTVYSESETFNNDNGTLQATTTVSSGTYRTYGSYRAYIGSKMVESTSGISPEKP